MHSIEDDMLCVSVSITEKGDSNSLKTEVFEREDDSVKFLEMQRLRSRSFNGH